MNFAALMSQEISKGSSKDDDNKGKKYQKRADVEAERKATYAAEQARLEAERAARAAKKRKIEEEETAIAQEREEKKRKIAEEARIKREAAAQEEERARRKRIGLPEFAPVNDSEANDADEDIADDELATKLRELGEPVTLFGETHKARLRRYRALASELLVKLNEGPIPTSLELLPESEMKVPAKFPKEPERREYVTRQLASYFSMVIGEWERAMEKEPQDTIASRNAYNAMLQCKENLTPLFRQFEANLLRDNLLDPITQIVHAAQERRYVDANDGYLRLSIGKAAWPIGVTMVGIHERSSREKLHEGNDTKKAHVMGDETTRKILQSIKRCLSYAQVRWPPGDARQLMG